MRGKGVADQLFPRYMFARRESNQINECTVVGMDKVLTERGELSRLLKLPGASEGLAPSNVASGTTNRL